MRFQQLRHQQTITLTMQSITADQFASLVTSMSNLHTHDTGAFTVNIGTTPDGQRVAAIGDLLGNYHVIDHTIFE